MDCGYERSPAGKEGVRPTHCTNKFDPSDKTLQISRGLGLLAEGLLLSAVPFRAFTAPIQQITHWGGAIKPGSWVMTGSPTIRNWILSGMSHLPWNVETIEVGGNLLRYPPRFNWEKGFLGQRIYTP